MAFCGQVASIQDVNGVIRDTIVIDQSISVDSCSDNNLIILSASEYRQLSYNPLNLSLSDGVQLSAAIIFILALGFTYRVFIKLIVGISKEGESHE